MVAQTETLTGTETVTIGSGYAVCGNESIVCVPGSAGVSPARMSGRRTAAQPPGRGRPRARRHARMPDARHKRFRRLSLRRVIEHRGRARRRPPEKLPTTANQRHFLRGFRSRKPKRAIAIGQGASIATWARENRADSDKSEGHIRTVSDRSEWPEGLRCGENRSHGGTPLPSALRLWGASE